MANIVGKDPITPAPGDPNVIVLKQFEDTNRRILRDPRPSSSPTLSKIKLEDDEIPIKQDLETSLIEMAAAGGPDFKYLVQFRKVVWKQLAHAELEKTEEILAEISSAEILEHHAMYFPPVSMVSPR